MASTWAFQAQGLGAPFLVARLLLGQAGPFRGLQLEQAQQGMVEVVFQDVDVRDGARQGDVEGVDVEFEGVERAVALVARAAVGELALQVGLGHARGDLAERGGLAGDQSRKDDVLVLESLGLAHAEDQWRVEAAPRLLLVLLAQDDDREPRRPRRLAVEFGAGGPGILQERHAARPVADRPDQVVALAVDRAEARLLDPQQAVGDVDDGRGVAVVGVQHPHQLGAGSGVPFIEHRLEAGPGEEVGVDDLVRVAAQHELVAPPQPPERQAELDRGHVLHLVRHQEIVGRAAEGVVAVAHEIQIVAAAARQIVEIAPEQIVDGRALLGGKD